MKHSYRYIVFSPANKDVAGGTNLYIYIYPYSREENNVKPRDIYYAKILWQGGGGLSAGEKIKSKGKKEEN